MNMTIGEYAGLKAKVRCANSYLDQVKKQRGKVDTYDIHKVVSWEMWPLVDFCTDGSGPVVRIKEGVA